jgi:hypothetical protein
VHRNIIPILILILAGLLFSPVMPGHAAGISIMRHLPQGVSGKNWSPYTAYGIYADFPTLTEKLSVCVHADVGRMSSCFAPTAKTWISCQRLGLNYRIDIPRIKTEFQPAAGLSNNMIFMDTDFTFNDDLFHDSESEFGAFGGADLMFRKGKWMFRLPLQVNYVFSSPEPFLAMALGVCIGWGGK